MLDFVIEFCVKFRGYFLIEFCVRFCNWILC